MKIVFDTAKRYTKMPLHDVDRLLDSDFYEPRLGAFSILDFKARRNIDEYERWQLFEMYMNRHDRIDTWDLVDRAAPRVVGLYLKDKPRDPLFELAGSDDPWRRRTAITATFLLIRAGDTGDALKIADTLLPDDEELVNRSVGTALREVGRVDPEALIAFLERHPDMPRAAFRTATERLGVEEGTLFGRM